MNYFQEALQTFNGGNWYGWKKEDDNGNKIPNDQRMTYENINHKRWCYYAKRSRSKCKDTRIKRR